MPTLDPKWSTVTGRGQEDGRSNNKKVCKKHICLVLLFQKTWHGSFWCWSIALREYYHAHPVLFQKVLLFSADKSRIYPRLTNSRHIMISKTIGYPLIKREWWSYRAWDDEIRVLRPNISILPRPMVRSKVLLHFIAQYTHAPKDKVLDHAPHVLSFIFSFPFNFRVNNMDRVRFAFKSVFKRACTY